MTVKEMIEVLQAYEEGKPIQYRRSDWTTNEHPWKNVTLPFWDFNAYDYRVTPTRLEVANKFWKDTFGIDNAISDTCCPVPINKSCEECKIFDICRYEPMNWWNAPYKGEEGNNNDDNR